MKFKNVMKGIRYLFPIEYGIRSIYSSFTERTKKWNTLQPMDDNCLKSTLIMLNFFILE